MPACAVAQKMIIWRLMSADDTKDDKVCWVKSMGGLLNRKGNRGIRIDVGNGVQ